MILELFIEHLDTRFNSSICKVIPHDRRKDDQGRLPFLRESINQIIITLLIMLKNVTPA